VIRQLQLRITPVTDWLSADYWLAVRAMPACDLVTYSRRSPACVAPTRAVTVLRSRLSILIYRRLFASQSNEKQSRRISPY